MFFQSDFAEYFFRKLFSRKRKMICLFFFFFSFSRTTIFPNCFFSEIAKPIQLKPIERRGVDGASHERRAALRSKAKQFRPCTFPISSRAPGRVCGARAFERGSPRTLAPPAIGILLILSRHGPLRVSWPPIDRPDQSRSALFPSEFPYVKVSLMSWNI